MAQVGITKSGGSGPSPKGPAPSASGDPSSAPKSSTSSSSKSGPASPTKRKDRVKEASESITTAGGVLDPHKTRRREDGESIAPIQAPDPSNSSRLKDAYVSVSNDGTTGSQGETGKVGFDWLRAGEVPKAEAFSAVPMIPSGQASVPLVPIAPAADVSANSDPYREGLKWAEEQVRGVFHQISKGIEGFLTPSGEAKASALNGTQAGQDSKLARDAAHQLEQQELEEELTTNATRKERRRLTVPFAPDMQADLQDFIERARQGNPQTLSWKKVIPSESLLVRYEEDPATQERKIIGAADLFYQPRENQLQLLKIETTRPGSGAFRDLITEAAQRAQNESSERGSPVDLIATTTADKKHYFEHLGFTVVQHGSGLFAQYTLKLDPAAQQKLLERSTAEPDFDPGTS